MATVHDTYKGPRHDGEYKRLVAQHYMFKDIMQGKLVLAPVNLSAPGLRVLDSATAEGYWLVDLSQETDSSAVLRGSDIAPQHFKESSQLPKNVSLFTHNIFDTWPADCQNSFDLVHQRFVLPECSDEKSLDVIQKLQQCVEPGGWLQLHEADFDTIREGPGHEAMERFREVMQKSWVMLGFNLSPGPKLVEWMEEVGLKNVQEQVVEVLVGAAAKDAGAGQKPIEILLATLGSVEIHAGKLPGYFFSADEFAKLKVDLRQELETNGNSYRTHVVWAQRPA